MKLDNKLMVRIRTLAVTTRKSAAWLTTTFSNSKTDPGRHSPIKIDPGLFAQLTDNYTWSDPICLSLCFLFLPGQNQYNFVGITVPCGIGLRIVTWSVDQHNY